MKRITFLFVLLCILISPTLASANETIQACLTSWSDHPFDAQNPKFRTVSGHFKIFGIGNDINESTPTDKPELVLILPNVSVMTGSSMTLMNPNGWYCLRSTVNVMGYSEIKLHCKAHIASTKSGTAVLGSNEGEIDQGVTVMGKSTIIRQGCE